MGSKTIEIQIGKRTYPIEVENETEETKVKLSAQLVNDNINKLKGNYVVTDYVDLLAMTALEFASNGPDTSEANESAYNKLMDDELAELNSKLDEVLNS